MNFIKRYMQACKAKHEAEAEREVLYFLEKLHDCWVHVGPTVTTVVNILNTAFPPERKG